MKNDKVQKFLTRYKYPLIILLAGVLLLLIPTKNSDNDNSLNDEEYRLEQILGQCSGVGEVSVIISEHGAVIVCDGAEDARVRLDIINSVKAYTGLSCDNIQVLLTTSQN